jgi:hypothetical protein
LHTYICMYRQTSLLWQTKMTKTVNFYII